MGRLFGAAAGVASLVFAGSLGQASANPPVEAFGQLPILSSPRLAPDGRHFAVIQPLDGRPAALIYEIGGAPDATPKVFGARDWIIEDLIWVNNDRLILTIKLQKKPEGTGDLRTWERSLSVSASGGPVAVLFEN